MSDCRCCSRCPARNISRRGQPRPQGRRIAQTIIPDAGAQKIVLIGGGGIGRIPDYMAAPAVASEQLVRIFPDLKGELIEIHALYPSHRSLSAKVRVFIDALRQHIVSERASL
ncbi:LysR substrate-binding domain-containing protein [Pseudomonas sp. ANT_H4]|uniref:LysR substrate-binding domain-containing protein n=1 Tax=Pseudomonas sp. ANT_H4 TaxID=2597350 RepID=UPI0035326C7F